MNVPAGKFRPSRVPPSHAATGTTCVGLYNDAVSDDDLSLLRDLPRLDYVAIGSSNITDAAMDYLRRFPNLEYIRLKGTRVTLARVASLCKELPDCRIDFDGRLAEKPKSLHGIDWVQRGCPIGAEFLKCPFHGTRYWSHVDVTRFSFWQRDRLPFTAPAIGK